MGSGMLGARPARGRCDQRRGGRPRSYELRVLADLASSPSTPPKRNNAQGCRVGRRARACCAGGVDVKRRFVLTRQFDAVDEEQTKISSLPVSSRHTGQSHAVRAYAGRGRRMGSVCARCAFRRRLVGGTRAHGGRLFLAPARAPRPPCAGAEPVRPLKTDTTGSCMGDRLVTCVHDAQ